MVRILFEKDAHLADREKGGVAALYVTPVKGYTVVAKLLLEQGANSAALTDAGRTPLIGAAANG